MNPNNVTSVLHSEPALMCEAACPRRQSTRAVTWTGHPVSELAWPRQPGGGLGGKSERQKESVFIWLLYQPHVALYRRAAKTFLNSVLIWGHTSLKKNKIVESRKNDYQKLPAVTEN